MVFADDIRRTILRMAEECGADKTFGPSDVARALDSKNWRELLAQVSLVADILIHEGKITAKRSGKSLVQFAKAPLRVKK